jgi:hypothetical protein
MLPLRLILIIEEVLLIFENLEVFFVKIDLLGMGF